MRKTALIAAFIIACAAQAAHAVNPYGWKVTNSTTSRKATAVMSGDIKVFDNIDRSSTSFEINGGSITKMMSLTVTSGGATINGNITSTGTLTLKNQAGVGKVLTSNATGIAAWTQMTYNAPPSELSISTNGANVVQISAASVGIEEYVAVSISTSASLACSGSSGCLDTGAEAASTWYYAWLIYDSSGTNGVGFILSTSSTSPTMPSGFNKKRRIDAIYNNAASNLNTFLTLDDGFHYHMYVTEASFSGDPASGWTTVTLSTVTSPPIACIVGLGIQITTDGTGGGSVGIAPVGHSMSNSLVNPEIATVGAASQVATGRGSVPQTSGRTVSIDTTANVNAYAGGVYGFRLPNR